MIDYFFSGNRYIRVTRGEIGPGRIDPGYPAPISNWGWGRLAPTASTPPSSAAVARSGSLFQGSPMIPGFPMIPAIKAINIYNGRPGNSCCFRLNWLQDSAALNSEPSYSVSKYCCLLTMLKVIAFTS